MILNFKNLAGKKSTPCRNPHGVLFVPARLFSLEVSGDNMWGFIGDIQLCYAFLRIPIVICDSTMKKDSAGRKSTPCGFRQGVLFFPAQIVFFFSSFIVHNLVQDEELAAKVFNYSSMYMQALQATERLYPGFQLYYMQRLWGLSSRSLVTFMALKRNKEFKMYAGLTKTAFIMQRDFVSMLNELYQEGDPEPIKKRHKGFMESPAIPFQLKQLKDGSLDEEVHC